MDSVLDVKLRPFAQGDLDAVRQVILATIDACYCGVYPPRAVEFFKQYHCDANILDRAANGYTVVGECEGRVVATGSIIADHICAVFVLPAIQGGSTSVSATGCQRTPTLTLAKTSGLIIGMQPNDSLLPSRDPGNVQSKTALVGYCCSVR